MKGRAMSHPLRTWVARPALCCCQMPYFMDDPDRFSEAGQKHWPELMETHSETLAYPHPVVMPTVDLKKKSLVLRNPWHHFCQKAEKDLRRYVEDMDFEVQSCSTVNGNHITSLMEGSSPSTPCEERS